MKIHTLILSAGLLAAGYAHAIDSAAGRWVTIDDKTGKPKSIVVIEEKNGQFEGRVDKILSGDNLDPVCTECSDARKGQKVVGMTILTGLKREGRTYSGGEILDPKNGSVYRAKAQLSDDGKSLELRGYLGVSLFGRSQTWQREQ